MRNMTDVMCLFVLLLIATDEAVKLVSGESILAANRFSGELKTKSGESNSARKLLSDHESDLSDVDAQKAVDCALWGVCGTPGLVLAGLSGAKYHRRRLERRDKRRLKRSVERILQLQRNEQARLQGDFNKNAEELSKLDEQIAVEKSELKASGSNFSAGKDHAKKLVVMLGNTGDGKSTLCNRLNGDETMKCSEPGALFKVNGSARSVTKKVSSALLTFGGDDITVVDTPGMGDSQGKGYDRRHTNEVCQYLRGCGGINAFVLVTGSNPRGSDTKLKLLEGFYDMFNMSFFDRLIIVMTNVESFKAEQFTENDVAEGTREWITEKFPGLKLPMIPVIPIGFDSNPEFYKESLRQLIAAIPGNRIEIDQIKSPLDVLMVKQRGLLKKVREVGGDLQAANNDVQKSETKVREIEQWVEQHKREEQKPRMPNTCWA